MKLRKPSKKTVLVVLIFASLGMSFVSPGVAGRVRMAAQAVLAPLGDAGMYLTTAFKAKTRDIGTPDVSPEEGRRLREENRELQGRLLTVEREFRRIQQEEETTGALYGQLKDFPCVLIAGRVVGADALPYASTRVINVGSSKGAEPGQRVTSLSLLTDCSKALPPNLAAISTTALVGRLAETGPFSARLQLLTDRGFQIHARIRRVVDPAHPRRVTMMRPDGTAAVQTLTAASDPIDCTAVGDGAEGLVAEHIPAMHNILEGDWLVTRDDDAFLPAEIRIGRVVQVSEEAKYPSFVTVRFRPEADFASLREVYVVIPQGKPIEQKKAR